jgi:hypothetical protein
MWQPGWDWDSKEYSMNWCDINLARDLICPPKRRILLHWIMVFYLIAAFFVLLLSVFSASKNIKNGMDFLRQTSEIKSRFESNYPNEQSLGDYAPALKTELKSDAAEARSISDALPDNLQTMLPLISSLVNQPDDSQIYNLSFVQQAKNSQRPSLEFSLYLPISAKSSPRFLSEWQKKRELTQRFADIIPVTTKRGWVNNSSVSIMSYKVEFEE